MVRCQTGVTTGQEGSFSGGALSGLVPRLSVRPQPVTGNPIALACGGALRTELERQLVTSQSDNLPTRILRYSQIVVVSLAEVAT